MGVHKESMFEFGRSANSDRMPLIIIQIMWAIVLYADGAITQIEYVMNMPVHYLHCDEILPLPRIIHH